MESKKKVSRFEFAIMQICDPAYAANYEPYTETEEIEQRQQHIKETLNKIKIKGNEQHNTTT